MVESLASRGALIPHSYEITEDNRQHITATVCSAVIADSGNFNSGRLSEMHGGPEGIMGNIYQQAAVIFLLTLKPFSCSLHFADAACYCRCAEDPGPRGSVHLGGESG